VVPVMAIDQRNNPHTPWASYFQPTHWPDKAPQVWVRTASAFPVWVAVGWEKFPMTTASLGTDSTKHPRHHNQGVLVVAESVDAVVSVRAETATVWSCWIPLEQTLCGPAFAAVLQRLAKAMTDLYSSHRLVAEPATLETEEDIAPGSAIDNRVVVVLFEEDFPCIGGSEARSGMNEGEVSQGDLSTCPVLVQIRPAGVAAQ
jgi:hypothetical protein